MDELQRYQPDILQLRPSGILTYRQTHCPDTSSNTFRDNQSNLTRGEFNGYLSVKTKRIIKKRIGVWIESIRIANKSHKTQRNQPGSYPTFVTLTLPSKQKHNDNYLKRNALGIFLTSLKRKYKFTYWFWRAEAQRNGNIHFHLIIDNYVPWNVLRRDWNTVMERLGYIEEYRNKHQGMTLADYKKKYRTGITAKDKALGRRFDQGNAENWSNPNSTDVKKLDQYASAVNYLMKYACKSGQGEIVDMARANMAADGMSDEEINKEIRNIPDQYKVRKIEGRIWGCSDRLKELNYPEVLCDANTMQLIDYLNKQDNKYIIEGEFYSYYCFDFSRLDLEQTGKLYEIYYGSYLETWTSIYSNSNGNKEGTGHATDRHCNDIRSIEKEQVCLRGKGKEVVVTDPDTYSNDPISNNSRGAGNNNKINSYVPRLQLELRLLF